MILSRACVTCSYPFSWCGRRLSLHSGGASECAALSSASRFVVPENKKKKERRGRGGKGGRGEGGGGERGEGETRYHRALRTVPILSRYSSGVGLRCACITT